MHADALAAYLYTKAISDEDWMIVLDCIRNSRHAITVKEISSAIDIPNTRTKAAVSSLKKMGLVVRDGRSSRDAENDAMYYTNPKKKNCIYIFLAAQMY